MINLNNEGIAAALAHAIVALRRLSALGHDVWQVDLRGGKAVLRLRDADCQLPARNIKRMTVNDTVYCTWEADLDGCIVTWETREPWDRRRSAEIPAEAEAEAKLHDRLLPKLAAVHTLDGDPVAVMTVDELPPCVGERMRDVLAERAIATLADREDEHGALA